MYKDSKNNDSKNIIGYVPLRNGLKEVTTLDNYFLTYTFAQKMYWKTLRDMTNIFYNAYIEHYKDTSITPIEGEIIVKTEVTHYENVETATPKRQDMRIGSDKKIDYVEFQRRPHPNLPIDERSVQYFGFSLTSGCDKHTSHLWLLDGEVGKLLQKDTFANYILMTEIDHHPHPNTNNILYVNLKRLARADTPAGELANVLIGKVKTPTYPEVRLILKNLKNSFEVFREDNKVRDYMNIREQQVAIGEAKARAELTPIIAEKDEQLSEKDEQLSKKDKQIAELKAQLAKQNN